MKKIQNKQEEHLPQSAAAWIGQVSTIEELVERVINYSNDSNGRLYETMNQSYLLSLLDKTKIIEIEQNFPTRGLDIIDFVRLMLNNINHKEDETLYLTMALIELFKQISESLNLSQTIQMRHITSVICDQLNDKNAAHQYKIQTVKMPEPQKYKIDLSRVRSIDINPPPIFGRYDEDLQRLVKQKVKTDSMHHLNNRIKTGVYAKDMKLIISLDSLADRLNMHDLDCNFKHFVRPKSNYAAEEVVPNDIIIFSFAWSERQQRLGATLKDFTLSFWDRNDNFKYEKQIQIQNLLSDYQTNIWFLEFLNSWITTDAKNKLYQWDLEKECIQQTFSSPKIKHTIFQIAEIPQLKLVAVGSSDRLITIWDFSKASIVQIIEFYKAGIHSFVYFESYSVLVCGGFQNNISIHQIESPYLDVNLKGYLVGHQSMITAIDCIEKTPMVISSDDSGTIKIWDIRTMKCIQTVDCGQRTVITKILNIYLEGRLCFLGTRINVIDFDESDFIVKKYQTHEELFPIKVEYSLDQLIVVTRKDIRFVSIDTGRIQQIFVGLQGEGSDEITAFKQIEQGRKFILGNHKGEITMHSIENGEIVSKLHSHTNEVTNIRIDYLNKLLISGGWDSCIKIQHLSESDSEIKREITNCFFNKEITLIEISVYHNLIFAASNSDTIYIFDYEFAKLISTIKLQESVEVTAMQVINGFSLLFLSTNDGFIHVLNFLKKEFNFSAQLIGQIDVSHLLEFHNKKYDCSPCQIISILEQTESSDNGIPSYYQIISKPTYYVQNTVSFQKGNTNTNNLDSPGTNKNIPGNKVEILGNKINKGKTTIASHQSTFSDSKENISQFFQQEEKKSENNNDEGISKEQNNDNNTYQRAAMFVNKFILDCQFSDENTEPENVRICQLNIFCSTNKGDIFAVNMLKFYQQFENIVYTEHCNKRTNYNAFRANTENFLKSVQQIKNETVCVYSGITKWSNEGRKCTDNELHKFIYSNLIFHKPNAHKDLVTSLKIIKLTENCLLTSSMDCYVNIWDQKTGELKASRNVNHPLPILWKIQKNVQLDGKKRIVFALKILDVISKKYGQDLSFKEARQLRVSEFISQVALGNEVKFSGQENKQVDMELRGSQEKKSVITMRDEYEPRDLKYDQSKQFFLEELRGPSLKRMEANKRISIMTKAWQLENDSKQAEINNRIREEAHMNKNHQQEEREELVLFLQQNYRDKLLGNDFKKLSENFQRQTQELQRKLDATIILKKKNAQQGTTSIRKIPSMQTFGLKKQGTKIISDEATNQLQKKAEVNKPNNSVSVIMSVHSQLNKSSNEQLPMNLSKRKSCQDIYNYAQKRQYIDFEGKSLLHTDINYPIYHTHRQNQQSSNLSSQAHSLIPFQNASFIQQNNGVSTLGGDSLIHDMQLNDITQNGSQQQKQNLQGDDKLIQKQPLGDDVKEKQNNIINETIDNKTNLNNQTISQGIDNGDQNSLHNNSITTAFANISIVDNNNHNSTTMASVLERPVESKNFNETNDSSIEDQKAEGYLRQQNTKNTKLSQLLKSMDLKVKKSQHNFADESIVTNFLKHRSYMSSRDSTSLIKQSDQTKQTQQSNMSSRQEKNNNLPLGNNQDHRNSKSNTQHIPYLQQVLPSESSATELYLAKAQESGNALTKKKNSSTLSIAGLETLKVALYGEKQNQDQKRGQFSCNSSYHYHPNKSLIKSPSSALFSQGQASIARKETKIQEKTDFFKKKEDFPKILEKSKNGQDSEKILTSMHGNIFDQPPEIQSRIQMQTFLTNNLRNALNIYNSITDEGITLSKKGQNSQRKNEK